MNSDLEKSIDSILVKIKMRFSIHRFLSGRQVLNMERAKSAFKYSALKLWNEMPVDIRDASTLKCFKTKLIAHLLADQK